MTIKDIIQKYKDKLDILDAELIIANSLAKPREFVLTHPEYEIPDDRSSAIGNLIKRRIGGEPLAYITGHREFYGLDFKVNEHTLIPRPETEMLVEDVLRSLRNMLRNKENSVMIADIGTGSGNIIISLAHELRDNENVSFFGIDMSEGALEVAKENAKTHEVDGKIFFLHGNLLEPLIEKYESSITSHQSLIITANLPYLSKEIYESAPTDVKEFEPKTALFSGLQGLAHYKELFEQTRDLITARNPLSVTILLEYSPEQRTPLQELIREIFPKAETEFKKDLAEKWRTVKITLP